jgi:2-polyprenyl-3-methyl-5-hydroxy-6-metoxy-1,4-benzoquinol methylase
MTLRAVAGILTRQGTTTGEIERSPSQGKTRLADEIMFDSRLRRYDDLFASLALAPLGGRRLLDAGCANGKWLEICCRRWGAQRAHCFGNDIRELPWRDWRRVNLDSEITFIPKASHELDLAPESFDVVHQSMMLSSIVDPGIRTRTAEVLWGLLRPNGILISYDFWLNPQNPCTVGIHPAELRRLFPHGRKVYARSLTLAPPLARKLTVLRKPVLLALEKVRVMNSHLLVALQRPE